MAGALEINGKARQAEGKVMEYDPISAKNRARLHQFGNTVPPGSFMGCVLYAERI